jgi:hypothetical protein
MHGSAGTVAETSSAKLANAQGSNKPAGKIMLHSLHAESP